MADDDDDDEQRSRSDLARERKREESRLADLAKALVGLSKKQLAKIALDEALLDAVMEARRLTAHAALARQLRIVRRELREADSHALARAVEEIVNPTGRVAPVVRAAEGWVVRILEEGALEAFVAAHEHADRQRLRTLVRNTRAADAKKAAKARKALQQALEGVLRAVETTQ